MLPKDRILYALQVKSSAPSEQPVLPAALLSGGTWAFRQKGLTLQEVLEKPELGVSAIITINQCIQSDIVWPGSGYHNLLAHIFGGRIKFRPQGNIDVIEPAFAKVTEAYRLDLSRIDSHEWICAIRTIISQVNRQIGNSVLVGTSGWGPFTLAGQFYGVEKLMSGLYKDKAGTHALLEVMTAVCIAYLAPAIDRGAGIVSVAEPTASGDLISLSHFEEFAAPYIKKVNEELKNRGAYTALHICGNIKDRVSLAPLMGVDVLSVDYKVDLALAQQRLAGQTALAGNVNPLLLKDGSAAEVVQAAKQCIQQAGRGANYILMPGCDIPPGVPLVNAVAFLGAGRGEEDTSRVELSNVKYHRRA
ncbi:uroporphyrinogen decarboxylase family protein [Sporomusa sphaeroides]|uniref:Uroporphyrinogen decarboxylase n=1 Tax=Sporomusa sphaeroides DSM 2875 TaxID=1337886 RepID=A0ABP2C6N8_9FIRM|nr:uroporphyrinogen decarboxylase family protein [Sporomusa sphaeroides]OLS57411.1 uroporphyrinogen decarboxylase [Sporomusa sphaeroides DSM 2875]CVK18025.1 Uroporphyrinogen decarboxylase [Sporomusa sphaeroides DSM 2875]